MPFQDMRQNWSQRDQRRSTMFKDNHGRRYHASIEIKSGEPCGLIEARYTTPLPVPAMYLKRSNDPERPYDLRVDYDAWIRDIREERSEWEKRGRMLARKRYGPDYDARKPFSDDILEAIGAAPQAVEPVLAARQGNRWILGFTQVPDPRLVQFFEPTQLDPEYLRANEPDYRDPLDEFAELEEQHDPKAVGGHKVQVGPSKEAVRKAKYRAEQKLKKNARTLVTLENE